MKYYVYRHIRLDTKQPFYIGKGSSNRAFNTNSRNKIWKDITKNRKYKVEILKYFNEEQEAFNFEEHLIKLYKIYNLCKANICIGGGGVTGYTHDETALQKIKNATTGKSNPMYGKLHSRNSIIKNLKSNGCKRFEVVTIENKTVGYWYSKKECAKFLNITTNTVRGYLKTNKLMKSKQLYFRYTIC